MSDLYISRDSVVNGRRHTVSCDVCEHWQHQNKQYFFPMVKLFQANEKISEQYKHTQLWQHLLWQ